MRTIRFVHVGRSADLPAYNLPAALSVIQDSFRFRNHEEIISPESLSIARGRVPTSLLLDAGKGLVAKHYPEDYPVVYCRLPLEDDLIAEYGSEGAVVSFFGWTPKFSSHPVDKSFAYLLSAILANLFIEISIHSDTRGCPNDLCDRRMDINQGLEKGEYCPECRETILREISSGRFSVRDAASVLRILDFSVGRRPAFVMMPFRNEFDRVYNKAIRPTLEKRGLACQRADEIFEPREIMSVINEQILRARLVVADLSDRNPNVFYELGLAHAYEKPTILLCQDLNDVPFDLKHRQLIRYTPDDRGLQQLRKDLARHLP